MSVIYDAILGKLREGDQGSGPSPQPQQDTIREIAPAETSVELSDGFWYHYMSASGATYAIPTVAATDTGTHEIVLDVNCTNSTSVAFTYNGYDVTQALGVPALSQGDKVRFILFRSWVAANGNWYMKTMKLENFV